MAELWNSRLRLLSPTPSPLPLWSSRGMRIRRNPLISDPLKSRRLRMRPYAKLSQRCDRRSQSPKPDAPSAPNPSPARPHHLSNTKRHRPRRRQHTQRWDRRNETKRRRPRLQPEPSKRRRPPRLRLCARRIPHAALAARGTNAGSSGEADLELPIRSELDIRGKGEGDVVAVMDVGGLDGAAVQGYMHRHGARD